MNQNVVLSLSEWKRAVSPLIREDADLGAMSRFEPACNWFATNVVGKVNGKTFQISSYKVNGLKELYTAVEDRDIVLYTIMDMSDPLFPMSRYIVRLAYV